MAWNETKLTMVGRVCSDVTTKLTGEGEAMTRFALISTQRKFDRDNNMWVNGRELFMRVTCFRRLAETVAETFVKGDPVVATGRIHTNKWIDKDGRTQSEIVMEAVAVGPDLSLCKVAMLRGERSGLPVEAVAA
nr:single-stranded DNA-binding protein [Kibdelosporangium sp. MJ126-NF4]CEL21346.1 Single-stranded DNA-binding protein [Kibdelosporangium sp. MJ126-NF4]CTQ96087.1 Single-stranded DNA-binding protein [Kibdelosporangium sp. MJ126-NF4]